MKNLPSSIIIEGIDRLGKSTLIEGIKALKYYDVIHYQKPPKDLGPHTTPRDYQQASFTNMFHLLKGTANMICDRAHLGEYVYAPLYRGYEGNYVFNIEQSFSLQNVRLILLVEGPGAKHFKDDGLSLGPVQARAIEQDLFIQAFNKSRIYDKRIVCVTDPRNGQFKDKELILAECLT